MMSGLRCGAVERRIQGEIRMNAKPHIKSPRNKETHWQEGGR